MNLQIKSGDWKIASISFVNGVRVLEYQRLLNLSKRTYPVTGHIMFPVLASLKIELSDEQYKAFAATDDMDLESLSLRIADSFSCSRIQLNIDTEEYKGSVLEVESGKND